MRQPVDVSDAISLLNNTSLITSHQRLRILRLDDIGVYGLPCWRCERNSLYNELLKIKYVSSRYTISMLKLCYINSYLLYFNIYVFIYI